MKSSQSFFKSEVYAFILSSLAQENECDGIVYPGADIISPHLLSIAQIYCGFRNVFGFGFYCA
jgi:hypothetical protein